MDITGSYTFNAPQARVWELLMDTGAIAGCIPGCEAFEPDGVDRYKVKLNIALAAVTGTYDGTVVLSEQVAPSSYRLTGEGAGRAGSVKGSTAVTLRAEGETTIVDVTATVQTAGAIARVGQRLIGSVSKMMMDRFFACLASKV